MNSETLETHRGRIARLLEHRALPYWLGLFSALLMLEALGAGFQLDDHFQRFRLLDLGEPSIRLFEFYDGSAVRNRMLMDDGFLPWWSSEDLRHKNFRYLSVLTMQLDFALWPDRPSMMHLQSLLWFAGAMTALTWLYRGVIGPTWVAGLAALLYAVDDAHFAPVQYLANRNAVIATCMGVLCLLCFSRWRQLGWKPGAFLSPIFLAMALGAAEIGVATTAYLASYSLFMDRAPWSRRALALAPCAAIGLLWAAAYHSFGFGASGSGFYTHPLSDPLGFLELFWQRAPILLLGQWTPIPADLALSFDPTQSIVFVMQTAGLVSTAVIAALMTPLLVRSREARFWASGALLSLVPICLTGPQNRLLFFVGIGSWGLLAMFVGDVVAAWKGVGSRPWWWKGPAGVVVVALMIFHVLLAAPLGWITMRHQQGAEQNLKRALESVPKDGAIAQQTLILVNPPDHTYTVGAIRAYRRTRGEAAPRRTRALSVGHSPIEVTRIDERTIDLRLEYGLFSTPISRYFRSEARGLNVGDRFEVEELAIEIRSLKKPGDPETLRYRFAVPLEDAPLRWLRWEDRAYVPFAPPEIGETVELAPGRGIFDPDSI